MQLSSLVSERIRRIRQGLEKNVTLVHWTAWAMEIGIRFDYKFLSLNRGFGFIEKSLIDSGSQLTLIDVIKQLAIRNPLKMYAAIREIGGFTAFEIAKLGLTHFTPPPKKAGAGQCRQVFQ
jgi:hypothetical protein